MIQFEIDPNYEEQIQSDALIAAAEKALALTDMPSDSDLSVHISDDDRLQQLNKQYMGIDAPTDVLSFPVSFDNPETGGYYLGDIIISYPTATRQAEQAGHPVGDELVLLVVHAVLHLLEYDHDTPEEKAAMWALQDKILTALGVRARPKD